MNRERDDSIWRDRDAGMSYHAIGMKHDLSKERVRQILKKNGHKSCGEVTCIWRLFGVGHRKPRGGGDSA